VITLALDASTYVGSVCVVRGRDLLVARTVAMRDARSERLMPAVAEALADAGVAVAGVDRIVCGEGPGSFTSLRIAASIAKGLAVAAGRPLYALSSLALMVAALDPPPSRGEYLAVLDALRGEYYVVACVVADDGEIADVGEAALVDRKELDDVARDGRRLVGDKRGIAGAPHARGVVRAAALLERRGPVDLRTWEPRYGRVAEAQRRWEAAHGRSLLDA
jgi:tRNA threonylcarbamoyladenosine biosynthesis protein TsaB